MSIGAQRLRTGRSSGPAGYLDVLAASLGLVLGLAIGAPTLGVAVGAGAWLLQRVLAHVDRGVVMRAQEPRNRLGLHLAEGFGRIWLLAGAIVAAGVIGGRPDGLAAAVLICACYSVAFAVKVIYGPPSTRARGQA
ncbi:MAG TPA: hypothetical protein VKU89_06395 [Solirubrobacteraceae bacterium]|nr:hypothetical protein [Solirubrobacteraceae bacterium]